MSTNIKTITGLQNLPNLQNFDADFNSLQTVDFSGLTNLTYIDISDCFDGDTYDDTLTSFNVTGCTALTELRVDDNNFSAGFPDLSSCTSLIYFDADQCNLEGLLNLSNIPALKGFDLSGNDNLTEVIISSTQPLGQDGYSLNFNTCTSLTQTALDNILQQLSSGSVNGGSINFQSSAVPSLNVGLPALRNLVDDKGWSFNGNANYNVRLDNVTDIYPTSGEACTAASNNFLETRYIYIGTNVEVGNRIFTDENLVFPLADGYFGELGDGTWIYQVSGGDGTIVAQTTCV
jgi:hypothetical protein